MLLMQNMERFIIILLLLFAVDLYCKMSFEETDIKSQFPLSLYPHHESVARTQIHIAWN